MVNNIIASVLVVIGMYNIVQGQMSDSIATPPLWWIKFGGMTLVGAGMLGYNLIPQLANFKLPKFVGEKSVAKDLSEDIQIKTDEEKDMTAIYYLTERCKSVGDGLELCKKLNDLFFDLHHSPKKD